ncbi:uncharacterized protein LOC128995061 [Macrosteles quadrilineatus]|uniref:uncharacterized protein LOC128995061 n=1 Tax=Macrosteles quadrilineatus TaxID=74068 RepID=UPI0023E25627|nr:uncharacterized protein LOC128995061 [Macrosteles quadrilineatus]
MKTMSGEMNQLNVGATMRNEHEVIDLPCLLEEVEKIDDLETLEDIENMLLLEEQTKKQELSVIYNSISHLKDELNQAKCLVKELDLQQIDEVKKNNNLRETIKLRELGITEEKSQQIMNLEQFEMDVAEISREFVTAPKLYFSNQLSDHITSNKRMLDEKKMDLQQQIELLNKAQAEFEESIVKESMDTPLQVLNSAMQKVSLSNKMLAKEVQEITSNMESLQFDRMTAALSKKK